MFCSMYIFCKEKFDFVIFHLQFQKLAIKCKKCQKWQCSLFFLPIFRVSKLDYGKYRKIAKFPADTLSFIYLPQKNTFERNTSSSVPKIKKNMQKMTQKIKLLNLVAIPEHFILCSYFWTFLAFSRKYLGLKMKQHYANIFSSEDFQWKKNLLKILQFFHISQTSFKDPKMTGNCHFTHFLCIFF